MNKFKFISKIEAATSAAHQACSVFASVSFAIIYFNDTRQCVSAIGKVTDVYRTGQTVMVPIFSNIYYIIYIYIIS